MPAWNQPNLLRHHRDRLRKDPGCLEDLLGISGRPITAAQYEALSHQVVRDAWAEFEAQKRDACNGGYHDATAYFVDGNLITAITDLPRSWFITCFHEHFDRPHGVVPGAVSIGQRKLVYRQRLIEAEDFKKYINVRRKRGV